MVKTLRHSMWDGYGSSWGWCLRNQYCLIVPLKKTLPMETTPGG
ncbi:hypothetical protein E2C01_020316 [Portunus trituberculatus]|uniref:Uncharacterized protein n=1 Tax=Portunus trituberculatus TaxID=210409 RepID=A0A5B7DZF5_PORTR|nr:hypothetical protein [Portunus trituberculatus]